ncbi:oxidoreductase [Paenibacillus sepulcri]|uniref:SDR family NAD(P)-dependent oxidoreductase n=1 Tax=Paenibacillus sepulcri TaxID=359917 RepID=A0ABS7C402_9BACL|nr:SDR family NAD(P)-dependent oxidoreductase [Paenibacillus sepulcri]
MNTNNHATPQEPILSGFGPRTTAQEVLGGQDLTGKIAIITGGYSGLGLEATRVLASAGATVIVPVKTVEKAQAALSEILGVELVRMDLMDPASIDAFAEKFLASNRPLHMLINAAGIMANPLVRDHRGYESQLATNHLGHFQLTARLWPALEKAKGARIVSVSSRAHQMSGIDFEDLNFNNRPYDKFVAYGQSKTANVLFAVEMDKRGRAYGVRAFSVHPGSILTDLSRYLTEDDMRAMGVLNEQGELVFPEFNDEFKTIPEGAATIVWCATSPQLNDKGGVYCENGDIASLTDTRFAPGVFEWAVNSGHAQRLWQTTEQLVGLEFSI